MTTAIEFLRELAERLHTQDNACTASPNYCIQENRLHCGVDEDYGGTVGWFENESNAPIDDSTSKYNELELYYDEYGREPNGWTRCGYEFRWEYTGISFMTHEAAHAYVAQCNYRHTYEIRVYVDSHYRNREMKEVRRLLAGPVVSCIGALDVAKGCIQYYKHGGSNYAKQANAAMAVIDAALAAIDTAREPHQ